MVKMSVETPVYHNNHDAFKQTKKQLMNTKLSEKNYHSIHIQVASYLSI